MIGRRFLQPFSVLALVATMAVAAPVAPALSQTAANTVDGFRSAKFQMTEDQVRQAIAADFKAASAKIDKKTDPTTRTTVHSILVDDMIADLGTAQVNYIFGYKSKRLIQVDVIWSKERDEKMTPEMIRAVLGNLGQTLRDRGFKREKTVVNAATNRANVVLLFRGEDEAGRVVALVARYGVDPKAEQGKQVLFDAPESAILSYLQNPKSPDVFKLDPGKF